MTPEQREELKQAAMKATPGPWEATRQSDEECNFVGYFIEAGKKAISDDGTAPDANDALYIAAANPAAILSLIAQVEALTVPQDDLRDAAQTLIDVLDGYSETLVPVNRNSVTVKRLRAMLTIPAIPGTKEGA